MCMITQYMVPETGHYRDVSPLYTRSAGDLCSSWPLKLPANRATTISKVASYFAWKKMELWGSQSSSPRAVAQKYQVPLLPTSHWPEWVTWANTRGTGIVILPYTQRMESWKYLVGIKMSAVLPEPIYWQRILYTFNLRNEMVNQEVH